MPAIDFTPEIDFKEETPTIDFKPEPEPIAAGTGETFSPESDYTPPNLQSLSEFLTAHPNIPKPKAPTESGFIRKAATGLARAGIGAVEGTLTPLTAGVVAASAIPGAGPAIATAAGVGFGTHMIISGIQEFKKAYEAGDVQGAAEALGNTVVGAFVGGASGRHGIKAADRALFSPEAGKDAALKQQALDQALANTFPNTPELAPLTTATARAATGETATPVLTTPPSLTFAPLTEAVAKDVIEPTEKGEPGAIQEPAPAQEAASVSKPEWEVAKQNAVNYWSGQSLGKLQQVRSYYAEKVADSPQRTETLAMLDEVIASKPPEPVAQPEPPPAPKKSGRFEKQEEPDDLISFIKDNVGKIRTKASAGEASQPDYEGAYKESIKHAAIKKLYSNSKDAQSLDDVAEALRRARRVPEDFNAGDLHDLLIANAQARKGRKGAATAEEKAIGREEAQRIDFEAALLKGKREVSEKAGVQPINVNDLFEGDTFELAGDKVTVKELRLDPESGDLAYVVLDDGRRFGTQTVGSDTVIHPDEGTLKQVDVSTEFAPPEPPAPPAPGPKLRRGENQGDVFSSQTEDLTLAGEKGTDFARAQAEKEAAAKASAEAKAAQDKAQGDLLRPGPGAETIGANQPPKTFTTSNKNAVVDAERQRRGLPPMMKVERLSNQEAWDNAMARIDREPDWQDRLIKELENKPRAVTPEENAALLHRRIDLNNEYEKAIYNWKEAFESGDLTRAADESARVQHWSDQLSDLERVTGKGGTGTESGRSLQARKMMVDEQYRLSRMEIESEAAKGQKLTPEERLNLVAAHEKIAATQKAFDEYVAKAESKQAEMAAKLAVEEMRKTAPEVHPRILELAERMVVKIESAADLARVRLRAKLGQLGAAPDPTIISDLAIIGSAKLARKAMNFAEWSNAMIKEFGPAVEQFLDDAWKASKARFERDMESASTKQDAPAVKKAIKKKQDLQAEKEDLLEGIKSAAEKEAINPDEEIDNLGRYVKELAKNFVEQGIKDLEPLTDALHATIEPIMPGITRRQIQDLFSDYGISKPASTVPLKVTLSQLRGEAQKVSALADIIEKQQAPLATGQQRVPMSDRARRLTKEINEAKKKYNIQPTDPARQLKSTLDAIKSRLNNAIRDAEFEIATRRKIVRTRNQVPSDAETTALRTRLDDLRSQLAEIFPKEPMSDEARLKIALHAAEKSELNWNKRLEEAKKGNFETGKPMPKKVTSKELEAIQARRDAAKEEVKLLKDSDPTIQESKAAQELETRRQALEKRIAEIQAKVAAKDISTKQPKLNRPLLPELEQAKQRLEKVNSELAQMRKDARPKKTPDQIALQSLKTRLANRTAELLDKVARGDYEPKSKRTPLDISKDTEAMKIKAENERVKSEYARGLHNYQMAKRTRAQKIWDGIKKTRGAFVNIVSSFDFSAPRQALTAILANGTRILTSPRQAVKMLAKPFAQMFRAWSSEDAARLVDQRIKNRPNAKNGADKIAEIEYTSLSTDKFTKHEENAHSILDEWAELPFKTGNLAKTIATAPLKAGIKGIRASNRAFITFLNSTRAELFDELLRVNFKDRPPTDLELKAVGNLVNLTTGRGKLNPKTASVASDFLWAPKLLASRVQMMAGQPFYRGTARTRRIVAEEYARIIAGGYLLWQTGRLFDEKKEPEITSSDFGKIVRGDVRVDMWGGFQQVTVFGARTATATTTSLRGKTSETGANRKYGQRGFWYMLMDFGRSKLRPDVGAVVDILDRKNMIGEPVTPVSVAAGLVVPISLKDVASVMRSQGFTEAMILQALGQFGAGVSTYEDINRQK